ncbi:alanyl-tRNA synthetase domain-containing protein [Gyrodon lividus]|nr:alanyl-tRNA synthetase domain-containing protein [Gyrodon lividus]
MRIRKGDPLLRKLETTVVSCTISQSGPPPGGRKSKKAPVPPASEIPTLQVILHDTVVFPEGGGQPSDTGLIETGDGRTWKVTQAKRYGGHAVHYVQADNVEADILQFAPAAKVVVTLGDADWDRRYDHMTIHTSQHLLSAVIESSLNIPTLSWSLTEAPAPCYIELARSMSPDEIQAVQTEVNQHVFKGLGVHVEVQEMDKPSEPGEQSSDPARGSNKAIPADYTGGIMRVVVIDSIDRNPCCGTHWPTLHSLQLFLIPQTETLARTNTTSARLYFFAGPRLIKYLTNTHIQLASAAATLSCGAPQVPTRVEQVVDERKRAEKRVEGLESELAKHIARSILEEIDQSSGRAFFKHVHRVDDSVNSLGFLSTIASAFAGVAPSESQYLLILSSTPSSQSTTGTNFFLIFGSDEKQVKAAGEQLKGNLGVRGGGKGTRWSGKFSGVWKEGREDVIVSDILQVAEKPQK